jgi:hypothetical protein
MTTQDWLPGLDEDDQQAETLPRRRWTVVAGTLAAVVGLSAVVGLAHHLAAAPPAHAAAASNAAAGTTADAPETGAVIIQARLSDPAVTGGGAVAPLIIGTQPVQGGTAPDRVPNFDSCQADPAALQYLPVQIRMPENWLSATLEVQATASTPSGIGRLGFFFQTGDSSTPCPDGDWSTSDSFEASNTGQSLITGYVVLDQAFTPATPQGRADVFRTLQLHVSDIRFSGRLVTVAPPTVGELCPGTDDELCAELG